MASTLDLFILIKAQDLASGLFNKVSSSLKAMNPAMGAIATAAAGIATGAVAFGVASVKAAGDYQESMNKVIALAGLGTDQANAMSDAVLKMAADTGEAPLKLSQSLYTVISAGFKGKDALEVLRQATMAARTGMVSTTVTIDALTSAMNTFHVPAAQASKIMDQMTQTVVQGKLEWSQYATVLGRLSTAAKGSGVSFQEANAALDTFTIQGTSAYWATTYLNTLMPTLMLKTTTLAKHAKTLGLAWNEDAYSSMKLEDRIKYLDALVHQHGETTQKANAELLALLGNNTVAYRSFTTLAGSLGTYENNLKGIQDANGTTATAFAQTQSGYNQSIDRMNAAFQVLLITVGLHILPVLTNLVGAITPLITSFTSWISSGQAVSQGLNFMGSQAQIVLPIIGALVGIVLTALIPALGGLATAVIAATWPVVLCAAIFAGLTFAFVQLYQKFGPFHDAMNQLGADMQQFGNTVGGVFDAIQRKAQIDTLNAKIATINNTIAQKQALIAGYEGQKKSIEQILDQTTSIVQRKMLEQKLAAINQAEQQAKGVINAANQQKAGVNAALSQVDPIVAIHALKQKQIAVSESLIQAQQTVSNLMRQKQGLEQILSQTTDITKRKSLEAQLAATQAALKQQQGVVNALEKQKSGVANALNQQQAIIKRDAGGNVLIAAWQGFLTMMGQIGNWIKTVLWPPLAQLGQFLAGEFMPAWQQIVQLWQGQLVPLFKQLWAAITPLLPELEMLGKFVGGILVVVFILLVAVIAAIIKGAAAMLADIVSALTGVVQIITGIIQVLSGIIQFFWDLFTGNFGKLRGDLNVIFAGVANIIGGFFQTIGSLVHAIFGTIGSILAGFFEGIVGGLAALGPAASGVKTVFQAIFNFIGGLFNDIGTAVNTFIGWIVWPFNWLYNELVGHSIVPDMCNAIVGWFGRLLGMVTGPIMGFVNWIVSGIVDLKNMVTDRIMQLVMEAVVIIQSWITQWQTKMGNMKTMLMGAIQGIWSWINSFLGGWPAKFLSWGQDMINQLIAGIKSGISGLMNTVQGMAQGVKKLLGFSVPEAGPMSDADTWMPDMIKLLTSGLEAGAPKIQGSMNMLLQPFLALQHPAPGLSSGLPLLSNLPSGGTTLSNANSSQQIVVQINVPNRSRNEAEMIAEQVHRILSQKLHRSGNLATDTSGARN